MVVGISRRRMELILVGISRRRMEHNHLAFLPFRKATLRDRSPCDLCGLSRCFLKDLCRLRHSAHFCHRQIRLQQQLLVILHQQRLASASA